MNLTRFAPLALAASAVLFAPAAHAATGMFCFSNFSMRLNSGDPQKIVVGQPFVTNTTVFSCSGLGTFTIPQLVAAGWQVNEPVAVIPQVIVPFTQLSVTAQHRIFIRK